LSPFTLYYPPRVILEVLKPLKSFTCRIFLCLATSDPHGVLSSFALPPSPTWFRTSLNPLHRQVFALHLGCVPPRSHRSHHSEVFSHFCWGMFQAHPPPTAEEHDRVYRALASVPQAGSRSSYVCHSMIAMFPGRTCAEYALHISAFPHFCIACPSSKISFSFFTSQSVRAVPGV